MKAVHEIYEDYIRIMTYGLVCIIIVVQYYFILLVCNPNKVTLTTCGGEDEC